MVGRRRFCRGKGVRGPADAGCQERFGCNTGGVAPPSRQTPRSRAPARGLGTCWPHVLNVEGMRKLECEFWRNMRGCSLFHVSSLLPTIAPPLFVWFRAWRWRTRAGNALVELSSLQHTGLWQCLVPCLAVRIEQECIGPKHAP